MGLPKKKPTEDEKDIDWDFLPFPEENRLDEVEPGDLGKELNVFYASGRRLGLSPQFLDWWLGRKA